MNKQEKALFQQWKLQQAQQTPPQAKELPAFPVIPQVDGVSREIRKREKLKFKDKWKLKTKPDRSYLVTFLFSNGTSKTFVISTREETFTYKNRMYYLDHTCSWFDLSHNQYRLFYFDDFSVPLNRIIDKKGDSAFFSVTPENLKPLIKQEYVKALAQSHELSKYLKFSLLLMIFNGIISIAIALMLYNSAYR